MTYEEFQNAVLAAVKDHLSDDYQISIQDIIKNNGVHLKTLAIFNPNSHITPTIYLERFYQKQLEGESLSLIVNEIISIYQEHIDDPELDVYTLQDFEQIKHDIVYRVINTSENQEILSSVPNLPFLDLSIVFYVVVSNDGDTHASMLIHNEHLHIWGDITIRDLILLANENTPRLLPFKLNMITDIIDQLRYDQSHANVPKDQELLDHPKQDQGDTSLYVLSNQYTMYGACAILYHDLLTTFANNLQQDLYIIPSSIHEVLLLPALPEIDPEEINQMIQEVNETQVPRADVLSDHLYKFSRQQKQISY